VARSSRLRLRTQLLVLLALLPAIGLALAYGRASERRARAVERAKSDVESLAGDLAREHAEVIEEARDLVTVLAAVPALREAGTCKNLLTPLVESFPRYANLGVVEADGRLRCSARGAATADLFLGDRPYVREARRTGAFAVSEYMVGRLTGQPIQAVAYPRRGDGGIVFASLDLTRLGDVMAEAGFPEGTRFLLTDDGGRVIAARAATPIPVGEPARDVPVFAALEGSGRNVIEAERDGQTWLVARSPLKETGGAAVVAVAFPAEAAFAEVRRDFLKDLVVLGLFGVAGIAFVAAADRRVLRPLDAVANAARRMERGELAARSGVPPGRGPVRELTAAFDEMAASIEEQTRRERFAATHDPLTGLPNRAALREHLARAIAEGRRVAVALVIVDRFHDIVNTLGHPTGDTLLRLIGPRLRDVVGPEVLVARVGGGEFAAVLPCEGLDDPALLVTARRMHDAMTPPFVAGGLQVEPGGSVGVAVHPDHGEGPDQLVQRAGVAAAVARRSCAEVVVYSPDIDPWTSRRLRLIGGLRGGIENGEMTALYQPKVSLATGRPVGAEALVRWRNAELGQVSPVEFIGLAEQTGAIRPLTRWVLRQAADYSRRLAEAGTPIRVSVNVSARDLTDPELAGQIAAIVEATGVAPANLELEVTESLLMLDPALARATLLKLREMGISLSIDDFGTGYCSLAYLRDLPVDAIKIDKSFVLGGSGPLKDVAITRSIVELGHNLGLEVLAEGVSSPSHARALCEIGCDVAQGELYGRPMEESAFTAWLRRALTAVPA
jgi:diguanylate cyclase (GGDEF)-like protein